MTRTKARKSQFTAHTGHCIAQQLSQASSPSVTPNLAMCPVTVMASKDHTSYSTFEYMKHSAVRVQGAGMCSLGPGKQQALQCYSINERKKQMYV